MCGIFNLDVSKMMDEVNAENKRRKNAFGYLPDMCRYSRCQLGALASQSFAKRMNSCANLVVTKHRLGLSDDYIEKLVVLRINKDFMTYCRRHQAMTILNLSDE